jgi:lysophospholipase L1-like esterase
MRRTVLLLSLCILVAGACQAQSHVAIGDSLAFGYQQAKFYSLFLSGTYTPDAFNTGFVDVMDNYLRTALPTFKTVNFSCPGETTTTLLQGGCPFHNWLIAFPLHQNYPGSTPQFTAAFQYLQSHPGEALLITVTIGANDILKLVDDCSGGATCMTQGLPAVSATASQNLYNTIFVLRYISPGSIVVYTNVPDPYIYSNPATLPIFAAFNTAMNTAATNAGARVTDWFTSQQQFDANTMCTLSFICTAPYYDIHPTDIGYAVLAWQTFQSLQ